MHECCEIVALVRENTALSSAWNGLQGSGGSAHRLSNDQLSSSVCWDVLSGAQLAKTPSSSSSDTLQLHLPSCKALPL